MEIETLKLGGVVSPEQKKKLKKKLKMFEEGLNYAINNMNYKQAERMLRKLNALPQPPLKASLGSRTRLYRIKTGGNLDRALSNIIEERTRNGEIGALQADSEKDIVRTLRSKGKKYG